MQGGLVFHVLNRANDRATIFRGPRDYAPFIEQLRASKERFGVRLFAFAVMPNHFHTVLRAERLSDLSSMMQWWMTSHVRRHHTIRGTSGHLWQGRFKSFPVQEDEHLLTVLRYVLLNPVRAHLVENAADWRWTSLRFPHFIDAWPVHPPRETASWLADGIPPSEIDRIRRSIERRAPFGDSNWQEQVAQLSGLEPTLRPLGRPKDTARAA